MKGEINSHESGNIERIDCESGVHFVEEINEEFVCEVHFVGSIPKENVK
jgi:hypothetical protein